MIRRFSSHLLAVLALVAAVNVVCQAESQSLLTRHTREVTLNGQAPMVGHLPASQSMRIVLVLPVRDQAGLDNFLKDVYDPSSTSFHTFLTVEQFTERFGPTQADYETVKQFAKDNGFRIVATSRNRLNLDVVGSVAAIENAFHITMGVYQRPTEARTFYAPDREPTTDMSVQLWHISGLDNYSIPKPALIRRPANTAAVHSNATTGSCPSKSFCGSDMRAAYYEGTALTGSGQSLGLLEYYGTDLTDLDTYYSNAGQTNLVPITLLSTDGTSTKCVYPSCDDTEQTIDMTQALGMAPGMSSLVMYVGSSDSAIFNSMATASPLNAQLSSSWTWTPADPKTDDPYFEEFAAQGQNLFQASGDSGGYKGSSPWPTNSVYVTAVGGTDLTTESAGGPWASETVWSDGGGGWGTNIDIPSWQVTAADTCNSLGGDCSKTYRDVPDVAANANFTFYVCADQEACSANEYGGTSFAAPMWAGYLALTNQQYLENGSKTTLGFINTALYAIGGSSSYSTDFHDITSSSNGSNGFTCVAGYNLCGGWGSPNGDNLINALATTTSSPSFTVSASPTKITIARGASGTVTITTTVSGGFDSAITLTATGQGGKQTVTFSPNPIPAPGSGTSTMTIKVGSTATTGNKKITVTATGGGLSLTTTVTLDVIN
ncbi:MAG: protease pro-enzyme activation domain-containing protein [Candidatus Sulfotelmatobacter sp.]